MKICLYFKSSLHTNNSKLISFKNQLNLFMLSTNESDCFLFFNLNKKNTFPVLPEANRRVTGELQESIQ